MRTSPNDAEPEFIRIPCQGLRAAYPGGIPELDLYPVVDALVSLGFSNRNIARILGLFYGVSYIEFLHEVAHVYPNRSISPDDKARVLDRLRPHGYESWRKLV